MTDKEALKITPEMEQTLLRAWHKVAAILFILLAIVAGHNLFLFAMIGNTIKIAYFFGDISLMLFCVFRVKNDYIKDVLKIAITPCMFMGLFIGISNQTQTQNAYTALGALSTLVFVAVVLIVMHNATKK